MGQDLELTYKKMKSVRKTIGFIIIILIYHFIQASPLKYKFEQNVFPKLLTIIHAALKRFLYYFPYDCYCKALLYFLWSA